MNTNEIRRLRRKFILIAMFSFLMVMLFIGAVINISSHIVTINSIKTALTGIEDNQGRRDDELFPEDESGRPFSPSFDEAFSPTYKHNHYFYMKYDSQSGTTETISNSNNTNELQLVDKYTRRILEGGETFGHYGVYYFQKKEADDGSFTLTLLDCTSELSSSLRLLSASVLTILFTLIVTFILVRVLSGKLIQPEIENSRRQKQFITNASHELKTPLAVIRANTELLEVTEGENEWTRSTLNQVDHMSGLIQNLVLISKAQEREDTSILSEIDASGIVKQTISSFEPLAKNMGKELESKVDDNVSVVADESKLRQLTTILLDNAINYCDDGGKISVALSQLKRGKNKIRLIVSNNYAEGEKIDCNRFFDRFYREDQSHNIDKGGYGIGLSIAESICKQYGGSIRAMFKDGIICFICQI